MGFITIELPISNLISLINFRKIKKQFFKIKILREIFYMNIVLRLLKDCFYFSSPLWREAQGFHGPMELSWGPGFHGDRWCWEPGYPWQRENYRPDAGTTIVRGEQGIHIKVEGRSWNKGMLCDSLNNSRINTPTLSWQNFYAWTKENVLRALNCWNIFSTLHMKSSILWQSTATHFPQSFNKLCQSLFQKGLGWDC